MPRFVPSWPCYWYVYIEYQNGGSTPDDDDFLASLRTRRRKDMQVIFMTNSDDRSYKGVRYNSQSADDDFQVRRFDIPESVTYMPAPSGELQIVSDASITNEQVGVLCSATWRLSGPRQFHVGERRSQSHPRAIRIGMLHAITQRSLDRPATERKSNQHETRACGGQSSIHSHHSV